MRKSKTASALLSLLLILAIHTSGMTAEVCLCGESCLHGFWGNGSNHRAAHVFHTHCAGGSCKSCNMEDGQTLKMVNVSSSSGNFKIFYTASIAALLPGSYPHDHANNGLTFICRCQSFPSSPIHLKNLTLLL